jgi:hypothetical protein
VITDSVGRLLTALSPLFVMIIIAFILLLIPVDKSLSETCRHWICHKCDRCDHGKVRPDWLKKKEYRERTGAIMAGRYRYVTRDICEDCLNGK